MEKLAYSVSTQIKGEEIHLFLFSDIFIRKKNMGSKFQLNEGEVQRILNLHKTAILKENKSIISEANGQTTYTTKQFNELEMNTVISGQGFKYGLPQGTVFSITDEKGKLRTKNATLYTAQSGKGNWSKSETSVSYICSQGKFYIKNFKNVNFYNEALSEALSNSICKTDPETQSSYDYNKVDKCTIRKPQVDGKVTTMDISYYYDGKSKCEKGQGSKGFSSIEDCTKKCVKQKEKEENAKDTYRKIMPIIDDEDEIIRGGESDGDDNKIGCENRHKTLECRSSQKNCKTESIRIQALINCKCPSNVLDALLRGFPKARTGNPGNYTLKEDGIFGSGSMAAWETCEDLIRRGSSRDDGKDDGDDKNKGENTTDDQKVKDEKGSNINVPKEKDLKLTPEEFAKLIQ